MYEYEVKNNATGEAFIIWGTYFANACQKYNINPDEYTILFCEKLEEDR